MSDAGRGTMRLLLPRRLGIATRVAVAVALGATLCTALGATLGGASAAAAAEGHHFESGESAVEGGRQALDRWRDFAWYDDAGDALRPADITPPRPPRNRGWNWSWASEWFRWIGWLGLAVALGLIAYFLIRTFLERETGQGEGGELGAGIAAGAEIDRVDALPFRVARGQSDLLGEARRQYEQGNFNEAIIYLYSYQLVQLDRHQRIRLGRGKTNRQYLREARSTSPLGDLLERTMVAFEDVFFGAQQLERERFESCWNQLDRFQGHLRQVAE